MSSNKIRKKRFWRNFIGFWAVVVIIFCIFIFNIKIGFTVFENIGSVFSFSALITFIIIIISIVLIGIYKIRKNRIESEEINESKE